MLTQHNNPATTDVTYGMQHITEFCQAVFVCYNAICREQLCSSTFSIRTALFHTHKQN